MKIVNGYFYRMVYILMSFTTSIEILLYYLNYKYEFLGTYVDYEIIVVNMILCFLICMMKKNDMDSQNVVIRSIIKMEIVCDILLIVGIYTTTEVKGVNLYIVLTILFINSVLNFLFYFVLASSRKNKMYWLLLNVSILLCIFAMYVNYGIHYLLLALLVIRLIVSLRFILLSKEQSIGRKHIYDKIAKHISNAKVNVFLISMLCLFSAGIIWGWFTKANHQDELLFDETGIAWDHKGHFVDVNGNVIINALKVNTEKKSVISTTLKRWLDKLQNIQTMELNNEFIIHDNKYFNNSIAVYYSEALGAYGFINENGKILTDAEFVTIDDSYDYEVIPVKKKWSGTWNAIDNQGNYLFENERWIGYFVDTENKLVYFRKEDGAIVLSGYGENNYKSQLVCYDYNTENGDIILLETSDSLIVTDLSGNTIYKSEKYDDYYGYEGSKGTIEYLLAKQASDDRWVFINCFGKPVLEKSFYTKRIMEKDGVHFVICDGYTSPDMTVLFFDGSVIETEYYYEDYIEEDGLLKVARKNDGNKEYNYLDLKGNLIFEEWIQE